MTNNYDQILSSIRGLTAAGYVLPDKVREVMEIIESTPSGENLIREVRTDAEAALLKGDGQAYAAAIERLMAAEFANGSQAQSKVGNEMRRVAAGILRDEVAESAWQFAADKYNDAGRRFAEVCASVDPDKSAEAAVSASEAEREAWTAVPALVSELNRGAELLHLILENLVRLTESDQDWRDAATWVGFLVRLDGADPAAVLDAWASAPRLLAQSDGRRGGRWAELIRLGATLETVERASDYERVELAPNASPEP
jgi:hypothetical protein